jgi:hypothetical protein
MTTHRNLKPHYAEPKGKSGPVIHIPLSGSMTEDELLQAITEAATYLGWRWFHIRRSDLAQQQGHSGFPDVVLAKEGRVIFLELKSRTGRLRPDQHAWAEAIGEQWTAAWPDNLDDVLTMLRVKPEPSW